jgi:CRISPR-associated protein Cmr2
MPYVLLISLGPIQDCIASARRCQDLWFGSWLLSDLARVTAMQLAQDCGEYALVFPGSLEVGDHEGQKPSVANKLLALVSRETDLAAVAAKAERAMQERLADLATRAFSKLPNDAHFSDALRERAQRQVADLMEFAWVAVPLQGAPSDPAAYAEARDRAERLLAARKNQRGWRQVALASDGGWGDNVPKSSLDGHRESVLHERLYDAIRTPRGATSLGARAERIRTRYFVRQQERLCGVGILKRVGSEVDDFEAGVRGTGSRRPVFHSTSHVATAPLRTRIGALGDTARAAVDAYARTILEMVPAESRRGLTLNRAPRTAVQLKHPFKAEHVATATVFGAQALDGRVLHRGQIAALVDDYVVDDAREAPAAVDRISKALAHLLRELGVSDDAVPAYYATVLADGDGMGAALDAVGRTAGVEGHRRVSAALDAFSRSCRSIVEAHAGSLVYAGGDDVLALLPLHTVLAGVRALHDRFGDTMREVFAELKVDAAPPSLSVGVGIAHHLDDMADARALAHRAERDAKSVDGKDALAIHVQMRSGGALRAVGRFGESQPLDARLHDWARLQIADAIPGKAAHDLEAEMAVLLQSGGTPRDDLARSLANRVLDRKRGKRGEEQLSKDVRALTDRALQGTNVAESVHALSHELQIARLIAGAITVAFPERAPRGGES